MPLLCSKLSCFSSYSDKKEYFNNLQDCRQKSCFHLAHFTSATLVHHAVLKHARYIPPSESFALLSSACNIFPHYEVSYETQWRGNSCMCLYVLYYICKYLCVLIDKIFFSERNIKMLTVALSIDTLFVFPEFLQWAGIIYAIKKKYSFLLDENDHPSSASSSLVPACSVAWSVCWLCGCVHFGNLSLYTGLCIFLNTFTLQ